MPRGTAGTPVETTNFRFGQAHLGEGDSVLACCFDAREGDIGYAGMQAFFLDGRFFVRKERAVHGREVADALVQDQVFENRVSRFLASGPPSATGGISAS